MLFHFLKSCGVGGACSLAVRRRLGCRNGTNSAGFRFGLLRRRVGRLVAPEERIRTENGETENGASHDNQIKNVENLLNDLGKLIQGRHVALHSLTSEEPSSL